MRSPTDHRILDLRLKVNQAAEEAMRVLGQYEPAIRNLAIRQMVVDVEITSAAMVMLTQPAQALHAIQALSPESNLLSMAQVAERCHVSVDAVRNWLRTKRLRKTKAGSRTVVRESDLQDFLNRSTGAAADPANRDPQAL